MGPSIVSMCVLVWRMLLLRRSVCVHCCWRRRIDAPIGWRGRWRETSMRRGDRARRDKSVLRCVFVCLLCLLLVIVVDSASASGRISLDGGIDSDTHRTQENTDDHTTRGGRSGIKQTQCVVDTHRHLCSCVGVVPFILFPLVCFVVCRRL